MSMTLSSFQEARNQYNLKKYHHAFNLITDLRDTDLLIDTFQHEPYFDLKSQDSNIITGTFECKYHPYLSLEYSLIEKVIPSFKLYEGTNNIHACLISESTEGIGHEQVVALFPENFRAKKISEKSPVYYFVDKFLKRHIKYTRPFIKNNKKAQFLPDISQSSHHDFLSIITNWVNLHESTHRRGALPLPKYLYEKSSKYTSALEELRADLGAIVECTKINSTDSERVLTYIVGERLLGYPLFRDKQNFDSISSVILWKYLYKNNFFDQPTLEKLKILIKNFMSDLENQEQFAKSQVLASDRRSILSEYALALLDKDYEASFNEYQNYWKENE